MATGSVSSLGIGSGVLTSDLIDKLKAADEAGTIKPIDDKITFNSQKQDSYSLLDSLMTTFKSSTSALSYDTLFDNKTVNISGDAEVTVDPGANVDSFTLETDVLAKKDITKLGAVDSRTDSIASDSGVLVLSIDGTDYDIDYDENTSLDDLAQSITDVAGADIDASILETSDGKYSLVISSATTGADQAITITDTDDGTNGDGSLDSALFDDSVDDGYEKIQDATDASFKYNGITTTRSTNDISDLIVGVDIKLKKEGDFSTVDISQDTKSITDEVQLFVDSYNSLMSNLNDMTAFDSDTGALGVFNGDSFVKGLKHDLSNSVSARFGDDGLANYGIDIDRYGVMSFDSGVLEDKLNTDEESVKTFFTGGTNDSGNETGGFFVSLNDKMKTYTGYNGLLDNFDAGLKKDASNLADAKAKAQASIDSRYDIMTQQFIAYDAMISQMNASFSSLQMTIDAETSSKS
jgi:flagellar hook-associated protein 2